VSSKPTVGLPGALLPGLDDFKHRLPPPFELQDREQHGRFIPPRDIEKKEISSPSSYNRDPAPHDPHSYRDESEMKIFASQERYEPIKTWWPSIHTFPPFIFWWIPKWWGFIVINLFLVIFIGNVPSLWFIWKSIFIVLKMISGRNPKMFIRSVQ
jgi:hypothetical protein